VGDSQRQIVERESRWSLRTGLISFAAVALLIGSAVVISSVHGQGNAELLRAAHEHSSAVTLSSILSALGFVLLLAPLYFLFRAASSRSSQMRRQLVGLVIAAPLFFAVSALCNGVATNEAGDQFAAGQAKSTLTAKEAGSECKSEEKENGAKEFGEEFDSGPSPQADCAKTKVGDDEATNALNEAAYRGVATGFGLGGRLGLAIALVYSCLWGMRVGLISRFWGSMGMALGVAALILLVQFVLIWFIYFGFLLIGKIPGGRPPAWAAGKAVPWPTPGERAAKDLEPSDPEDPGDDDPPDTGNGGSEFDSGPRRKRKRRG
jgi:hypothetical protein